MKELSRLLLKGEKNGSKERIVPYDNNLLVGFVTFVIFLELIKNVYFFYNHLSIELRLLYGDIIISSKEDQRLFNFVMSIIYLFILVYFYFYFFDKQKIRHYQLSEFLLVLDLNEYSRRFGVSRQFAERFSKRMDQLVKLNRLVIIGYIVITFSYYLTTLALAFSFGFSIEQILIFSCPSTISGGLAFGNRGFPKILFLSLVNGINLKFYPPMPFCPVYSYTVAIQCFSFFFLYVKLLNARVNRLTSELDGLDDRARHRRKTIDHLARLDALVKEFKVSQSYFERSLASFVPAILLIIALFPTILIVSERIFTNRLNGLFLLDLILIFIPIKSNESFKREVGGF